jgi:hypothetical protein
MGLMRNKDVAKLHAAANNRALFYLFNFYHHLTNSSIRLDLDERCRQKTRIT